MTQPGSALNPGTGLGLCISKGAARGRGGAYFPLWLVQAPWGCTASGKTPAVRLLLANPKGRPARRAFLYFSNTELFSSTFLLIFKL